VVPPVTSLLLRAICLVVYTGKETKLSLNSKTPPSKLSVVDSVVNRTLIIAISAMLIVCVISAVARSHLPHSPLPFLLSLNAPPHVYSIIWEIDNNNASYLCLNKDDLNDKYNGGGCESGATNSALTILTFATLFNNFVCIRLIFFPSLSFSPTPALFCNGDGVACMSRSR
jgi:hypothetical protein